MFHTLMPDVEKVLRRPRLAALVLLLPCLPVFAASLGIVSGKVEDPAGDPISGARITLTGPSGEAREAESDGKGLFAFEEVKPGAYGLRIEARVYQPLELPVDVTDKPPQALTIQMKIGLAEEVSVTGVNPDLEKTASTNNADVLEFDADFIQGLPTPVSNDRLMQFAGTFLSPASLGTDAVSIVVDGSDGASVGVPSSAIERIKVNRHPYSAEFRRPGKARLDVKTQDGSRRRFLGGAAYYLKHSALAARNAFATTKPKLDHRVFEVSLGGPLPRRLGTFFLSFQRESVEEEVIVNAETLEGSVNELFPTRDRFSSALARFDLKASDFHRFGARYYYSEETTQGRGVGGLRLPEAAYDGVVGPQHGVQVWAKSIFSTSYVNDLRVSLTSQGRREGHPAQGPALEVNGAFSGGSSQVYRTGDGLFVDAKDVGTYIRGAHSVRFGVGFSSASIDETEASDFGGGFEFASLDEYDQGVPYVYRVNQGNPELSFSFSELEAFVQDEVRLRPDLTLMAGLRYDHSSAIGDKNNVAPRFNVAWSPGRQRTVYRAGAGLFYERLSSRAIARRLLLDGERMQSLVITNPSYPDPLEGGETAAVPPSLFRTAPDLVTPYILQATLAAEHQASSRSQIAVEYGYVWGTHLFRARDVNAPLPGTEVRPDPTHGEILQAESTGSLRSHVLTLTCKARVSRRVKAQAQYALGWGWNDVGGTDPVAGFSFGVPADNYDLHPEWGRADFDRRHRFSLAGTGELGARFRLGVTLRAWSPEPYDITTGHDDNGDGHARDRPAGVTRNTGEGSDFLQLDALLSKSFAAPSPFRGSHQKPSEVQLVLEAFNVTNRVNYSPYIGAMTSPFFGTANSAKEARSLQLALRYRF